MFKKVMALMLVLVMAFSFAACTGKEEDNTTTDNATTNVNATDANTTDANGEDVTEDGSEEADVTEDNGETDVSSEESETDGKTTKKSDSKTTTKKSDSKTTTKKTDSKTTTKKTENKTTTKKSMVVPKGVDAIVKAYREAANRTKAQNNMNIDKTCLVKINIESIAGSEKIAGWANDIAGKYISQANGAVEKETFVNGKPTKKTELNDNGKYVNDKSTFIPLYGKSEMCTLAPSGVLSATATKATDSTYKVVIKLKDDKSDIFGTPKITASGMDHFNPNLYDLGVFKFASGTVSYSGCVILATIDEDGYIVSVEHQMKVRSTDAKLSVIGIKVSAAISGEYITTFKFY